MKVYLETSVVSGSIAEDEPKMKYFSNKLLSDIKNKVHEGFISTLVLEELKRSPIKKRIKLESKISRLKLEILKVNERILTLAQKYLEANLVPENYRADAIHIAVATMNSMDILASWNLSHIVRLKTIKGINEINNLEGLPRIIILTPEAVIKWKK